MENPVSETETATKKRVPFAPGVSYPIETVNDILTDSQRIIAETGTGKPISKEEISKILGRTVNTLTLYYSTLSQYGLFSLVHGKGYVPTSLYNQYINPKEDNSEEKTKLLIFKNAPLYAKIIENYNGHTLPTDERRFANALKDSPYKVNSNSADRAARIFFQNCRDLGLIKNGVFSFSIDSGTHKNSVEKEPVKHDPPPSINEERELPVQCEHGQGLLKYPKNLTKKDIRVYAKALEFIATYIPDSDLTVTITIIDNKEEQKKAVDAALK